MIDIQTLHPLFWLHLTGSLVLGLCCCQESTKAPDQGVAEAKHVETRSVTDMAGRTVSIPVTVDSIVCTGSNALRLVSYLQAVDLLVGVEETDLEYQKSTKRDYAHVYYSRFKDLPVIGKGGGTAYTAYPEEILKAAPDIILTSYAREATEQLQNETGIPVVNIRCDHSNFMDGEWAEALRLTADLLGKRDRCEQLLRYIADNREDLARRSAKAAATSKPKVYAGAVTFSGARGFTGTYAHFAPLEAVNARNVADETGEEAFFTVDREQIIQWDPDIIFLDPGNMHLVQKEYDSHPRFFETLTAVQQGRIYTMPSFNNYSTNMTYCLMNAYFAGKILYPDQFADIKMKDKGNEIMQRFLGKAYFDDMEADGLYYGPLPLKGHNKMQTPINERP